MQVHNGIGFGSSAIIVAELPGYGPDATPPADVVDDDLQAFEFAPWGSNNQQPKEMAALIEKCGVLAAALDAKARISVGKGIQPFLLRGFDDKNEEILEWVNDAEVHDWLEENDLFNTLLDLSYDENAYGWSAGSLILNVGKNKVNKLRRIDVYDARLAKKDEKTLRIEQLLLSADWNSLTTGLDEVVKLPVLRERDELDDLAAKIDGGNAPAELAFLNRRRRNGRQYYPQPLWWSANEWVKVAAEIPRYKNAMFKNQLSVKYLVTISRYYFETQVPQWNELTADKKREAMVDLYDSIDRQLTGTDKAFKSIFSGSHIDPVTKTETPHVKIEVLDDKIKEGKLLPESSAANSEILFAMMVNPALMGAGQPGGPYANNAGGSNIREAYLTAMMMLEAERQMNGRMMNVVKRINGWSKRLETDGARLVFRFQSGLLTTLDTGKSTKSENL